MRRRSRWGIVLGGLAVLVSVPAAIASFPVDDPDEPTSALLERIGSSAGQPFRGLFESRGGLGFPDLGRYEDARGDARRGDADRSRRVAGRTSAGLRITPRSTTTTVTAVELWVEPTSGVVLRVEIETGGANPIVETQFLDFAADDTSTGILRFDPEEASERVRTTSTFDVIEQISQAAALITPATAAVDLPRRGSPQAVTFGSDFAIVVVGLAPERGLGRALNALPPEVRPWGGEASLVQAPLINVEIATINGLNYIIAGTVTVAELDRIAGLIVLAS